MDPNSQWYYNSALKLRLPVAECEAIEGLKLTFGKKIYYFFDKATPNNNSTSSFMCTNKYWINNILRDAGIPVPKARLIDGSKYNIDTLVTIISELKFPLVVKPVLWSSKGIDVICCIPNIKELTKICDLLIKVYPFLLVEEYHANLTDYRVLIFNGKILDVIARYPAFVIGNGKNTIEELAHIKNIDRSNTSSLLQPILFDYETNFCLGNQGLTKESVPENDQRVQINYTCNSSRGGELKSQPITMHKENKKLFLNVAKTLGLSLVGLDVLCKDINQPLIPNGGVIIEANHAPSIRIHEEGIGGKPKQVTSIILKTYIYKHPFYYLLHLAKQIKHRILFAIIAAILITTPSIILLLNMLLRSK
ncbi:MAG: UDP-N-acetylmuramyl peptide synthase [Proteobacteria bacterium]|nr:UDP-N-acetylmuramyl peptide synthase [Pseudomonadota bacterium]